MSVLRSYCTLAQLKTRIKLDYSDTSDDQRLLAKIRAATQAIERYCGGREFMPYVEARTFDWESSLELGFRSFDLLTLTSIVDAQNTKQTIALIMQGGRYSDATKFGPWYGVEIDPTREYLYYLATPYRAITVNGAWGWHDDYGVSGATAFIDSGDTVVGATINSATMITVVNVSGSDVMGRFPRFSPGQMIQATVSGNTEWMFVTAADLTGALSLIGLPSDNDNFVINVNGTAYTYTFKTTPSAAGHVLIDTSITATAYNLYNALMDNGATTSTGTASYYAGTIPLPPSSVAVTYDKRSALIALGFISSSAAPTLAKTGANLAVSSTTPCTRLTVVRAQQGTTANSYSGGEKIYIYEPPADINEAAQRYAAFLFAQDDAPFNVTVDKQMGQTNIPVGMPKDVCTKLEPYVKVRVR